MLTSPCFQKLTFKEGFVCETLLQNKQNIEILDINSKLYMKKHCETIGKIFNTVSLSEHITSVKYFY